MALTIENATIGRDANNLQSTLNHIHNNCVETTKSALKTNLDELRTAVDNCWVGNSAEKFKEQMQRNVDDICKGLDLAYEGLCSTFNTAQSDMQAVDDSIAAGF